MVGQGGHGARRVRSSLDRKLLRDFRGMLGQSLAIALVIAGGFALYLVMIGMTVSLQNTRSAYYDRYRFAHVWAPAVRAPLALQEDIRGIAGVQAVETRIRAAALLDMPAMAEPATAELLSLPDAGQPAVNRIYMVSGRLPRATHRDEVVVLEKFAVAHNLKLGDHIEATIRGRRASLIVVGMATSPEHVYAVASGQIVPDDQLFAVLWMTRQALEFATDQDGAFNEAVVRLMHGASERAVRARLDALLAPYGGIGAYGRDGQFSDTFLSSELNQMATMARILPPVFLLVAAFLVNVVISRVIAVEREQIGLMKAFGYRDLDVLAHYLKLTTLIGLMGAAIGAALGAAMGRWLAGVYAEYFHFPFLLFSTDPVTYLSGFALVMAVVSGAGYLAVRSAVRLRPAIAMTPPPPPDYSRAIGSGISRWRMLDQQSRMISRHLLRYPWRGGFTLAGVAASIMLLVGTLFFLDSMERMIDSFFSASNRYHVAVSLVEPRSRSAYHELVRAPGVLAHEAFRSVPARLRNGPREEIGTLTGLVTDAQLSRLVDSAMRPVEPPPGGLVLSSDLAAKLDLGAGDLLEVAVTEGAQPTLLIPVSAVAETFIGSASYMRLGDLNTLMGEADLVSGAFLLVDESANETLFRQLKAAPGVAGVGLNALAARNFRDIIDQSLGWSVLIYTGFAGMIALGVIYNSVRISFAERARELASLRVLGFSRGEIAYVLLGEIAFVTLLALPVGCAAGTGLAWYLASAMSSDLYRLPFVIELPTYASAIGVAIVIAIGSGLIVRRQLDQLDLVAVLKTRE